MIVNGLPEAQPKVQQAQPASGAADKSAGNKVPETGKGKQ